MLWNCDFGQQLACDIVAVATAMTRGPLHAMTHDAGPDGLHVFGQDIVTRIEERPSARGVQQIQRATRAQSRAELRRLTRMRYQRLEVVEQGGCSMHLSYCALQFDELLHAEVG